MSTNTNRAAILAAAAERRAMRVRDGVKLGSDGQPATLVESTKRTAKAKGAKTPTDRQPRANQLTDEQLATIITDLKAANPNATASSMIGLVRAAGHKCNGGRIRATFWAVTNQPKGRQAKPATEGEQAPAATEAQLTAEQERRTQAKAEAKLVKAAKAQGLNPGDEGWPATPALDELNAAYEAKEAERTARDRAALAEAEAAPKAKRTRKAAAKDDEPVAEVVALDTAKPKATKAPAPKATRPATVTPLPKGGKPAKRSTSKKAAARKA